MRNLVVLQDVHVDLRHVGVATHFAVDDDAGRLYCCTASAGDNIPSTSVHCHAAASGEALWEVCIEDWAAAAVPDLEGAAAVVAFALVPELEALFIALASGHLLLADTSTKGPPAASSSRLEEVGCVAGGVRGAAWSPDGQALALVAGSGQLLLMNQGWEVLGEVPLREAGVGEDEGLPGGAVAVSWRGDGRFLATCSQDSPGGERVVRIWEREHCQLHSTGEGAAALHGVLAWQPNGRHLYAAQALPQQAAQAAAGSGSDAAAAGRAAEQARDALQQRVEHVGAWKRELRRQQAEAEARRLESGAAHRVLLFERNGLQHGGFDLPSLGGAVAALAWSPDSEYLAVVLGGQPGGGTLLQLWHRSNWHWYLQWQRSFSEADAPITLAWDESGAPLRLRALTGGAHFLTLAFGLAPTVSHLGTVAVVDGAHVLLTPMAHTIVPPPMCAARVVCCLGAAAAAAAPVACIALRDFGDREALAAVLSDGRVALAESCEEDLWEETAEEAEEALPDSGAGEPCLPAAALSGGLPAGVSGRQAAWLDEERLLVVGTACRAEGAAVAGSSDGCGDSLVELLMDAREGTATELATVPSPGRVLACASHPVLGAVLQLEGGQLWRYGGAAGGPPGQLQPDEGGSFPCSCPTMVTTPGAALALAPPGGCPLAFGLSGSGQLYWGGRQLASEVTSVAVRRDGPGGAFLLYTTRAHSLHTVSLTALLSGAAPPRPALASGAHAGHGGRRAAPAPDASVRALEQHALLVAAPPGGVTAVLQMPRGNLEAVAPRALVLPAVTEALDGGRYEAARELAAAQRCDLNVLVDYRWPAFLGHAREFVAQVTRDQDLADVISALAPESVAAAGGLYATAIPGGPPPAGPGSSAGAPEGKVAAACAAVRDALLALQPERGGGEGQGVALSKSLVTSHAKCGDLEAALALIQAAKEEALQAGSSAEAPPSAGGCSPEDALRHLLLTSPGDVLYRTALGMYCLPLAYMVVAHSQFDPGEYQLELQGFAAVAPPELRRHAIDLHLRRFDKAVSHLVAAGEGHFSEALELSRKHGLLRLLLKLVEGQPELRSQVLAAYAAELEGRGLSEDAALAFVAAGSLERAVQLYRVAGQWRSALAVAGRAAASAASAAGGGGGGGCGGAPASGVTAVRRLAGELAGDLAGCQRHAEAAALRLEHLGDVDGAVEALAEGKEWRDALRVAYGHGRADLVETLVAPAAAAAAAATLEESKEALARLAKYWARLRELRTKRDAWEAALAAADEESGLAPRHGDDWDAASDAASAASGLSMYTDHTHGGSTLSASSVRASTVGGRKPQRQKKSKGTRIREGSPEEEQQLANHLLSLAPTEAACAEAGQLCELLVVLGHERDARLLQQRVAAVVASSQEVCADLLAHPPRGMGQQLPPGLLPPGPQAAALAAALAAAPGVELQRRVADTQKAASTSWKWDILRDA